MSQQGPCPRHPSSTPCQASSSSSSSPDLLLVFRFLTFTCILISLIILTTNFQTLLVNTSELKLRFIDVYAYRYVLFALIIGMAYTLLQIAFGVYRVSARECKPSGFPQFDFYADVVMPYLQGTGTGAAFGATLDLTEAFSGLGSNVNKFFNKGNVVATFILFAFLFSTVSLVFSFSVVRVPRSGVVWMTAIIN